MLAHEVAKARRISAGKGCVRMRRKLVRSIASNCRSGCVTKLWRSSAAGKTAPPFRWRRSKEAMGRATLLLLHERAGNSEGDTEEQQRQRRDHRDVRRRNDCNR